MKFPKYGLLPLLVCAGSAVAAQNAPKPNVLFIIVDDLNDWISPLTGHPNMLTPNLERLKARGVTFSNTFCQAPISGPSRTSFLSGLRPSTSGVYYQIGDEKLRTNSKPLEDNQWMPEYFASNGYETFAAGKVFHNGDKAAIFQSYGGTFGLYGPVPEIRFKYNPEWFGKPKGTQTDWGAFPEKDEDMPDTKTTAWSISKLNERHDKPFFMAVGLVRPHVPWYVPQKWYDMISKEMATYPPYYAEDYADLPPIAKRITELPMMPDMEWAQQTGYWKEMVQAYMACVAFTDYNVGKLLDALDASKYGKNTIIVLCGDNGYDMGEKGRFSKHSLWRTSIHVPMIISVPKMAANQYSTANVGLIDIYPTLVELCNLPTNPKNQGRSIAPLLKNPSQTWDYPVNTSYGPKNQSIFHGKYHYIRYSDGSEELYDLATDREEWYNKAQDKAYTSTLEQMRKMLIEGSVPNVEGSTVPVNYYFMNGEDK